MAAFLSENASAVFTLIGTFAGGIGGFLAKWLLDGRYHKREVKRELLNFRRQTFAHVLEHQVAATQPELMELYRSLGLAIIIAGPQLAESLEKMREKTREILTAYSEGGMESANALIFAERQNMKELGKKVRDEMRAEICP